MSDNSVKCGKSPLLPIIKTVLYFDILKKVHQEMSVLLYPASDNDWNHRITTNERVVPVPIEVINVEQQTKEEKLQLPSKVEE